MIELVVTGSMMAGSVLLFGYWFRYTCLLILSAKTTRDYAGEVAAANQLSFVQVQADLRNRSAELDRLQAALDRDYAVITYLLQHAAHSAENESSLETRMLQMNYQVMRGCFLVSRRFSAELSRRAVGEMSLMVAHFANVMGERACAAAAA